MNYLYSLFIYPHFRLFLYRLVLYRVAWPVTFQVPADRLLSVRRAVGAVSAGPSAEHPTSRHPDIPTSRHPDIAALVYSPREGGIIKFPGQTRRRPLICRSGQEPLPHNAGHGHQGRVLKLHNPVAFQLVGCLLEFYILETSKVISQLVTVSAHWHKTRVWPTWGSC